MRTVNGMISAESNRPPEWHEDCTFSQNNNYDDDDMTDTRLAPKRNFWAYKMHDVISWQRMSACNSVQL